ncbi:MAG: peptidylprolyl isomerase [Wenzhouxiangella sp.]
MSKADTLITKELSLSFESPLVVRQGNVEVSQADVDAYMATRVPVEDQAAVLSSSDRIASILSSLVITNGMVDRARDAGLLDSTENQSRLHYALQRAIQDIYRQHFRQQTELDSYEQSARELFLTQPERFRGPETFDFEHLLIHVGDERTETEAMRLVLDLHEQVESGADLLALAQEYSDDPSIADNGGLLESISTAQLVPQVAAIVAETPLGELGMPVRSRFGWHLVRVVAANPPETLSWEEAQPRAEQMARDRHLTVATERMLRELQDGEAEFADGAIESLLRRYGATLGEGDFESMMERARAGQ